MNKTILFKEINEQPTCIERCCAFNESNIRALASIIDNFKPQNIVIVGRGTSMHAGIFAKHLFELYYHVPVSMAAQSIYTIYDSYTDLSKSLVIGISQSGGGKDNLTVMRKAKEMGALTIGIVNELESDLAKEAKYVLYCNANKAVAPAATKTFTTTIYLIAMLVYELTKNEKVKIEMSELKEAIKVGINQYNVVMSKIKPLTRARSFLTLGRGLSLSLAMETSLKIKETSHVSVTPYPLSEFHHGHIAALSEDMPVIIFDFEEKTRKDVKDVYDELSDNGIPMLLISNDKDFAQGKNSILVQNSNPLYAYFEATVIIQLLACELSLAKGYDPDHYPKFRPVATF